MKAIQAASTLLFLSSLVFPIFLVSEGKLGQEVSVLCESGSAYVSLPDGRTRQLPLDSAGEARFAAAAPGPYTVQCGNFTKTLQVAPAQEPAPGQEAALPLGALALFASLIFIAGVLSAAVLTYAFMLSGRTEFVKEVKGERARLFLKAGERMDAVRISDPVGIGCKGAPLSFSIPSLSAGQGWEHEYEMENPAQALPASLSARSGNGRISLLSQLYIDGGKAGAARHRGKEEEKQLRTIPRARQY